jgi:hypothetical protein
MKRILACAFLALAACDQPKTDQVAEAPVVEPGASGDENVIIKVDADKKNAVIFQFANGQIVRATAIGPVGGAYVAPDVGQAPQGLATILKAPNEGAPIFGYVVDSEAGRDPLCGAKEVVSIAVMTVETGKATLAAITGAHFGEEGALICNTREVSLTDETTRFAN